MAKKDEKGPPLQGSFNNPFAKLGGLKDSLPSRPLAEKPAAEPKGPARAVVRYERKGRGGKEVTLVEQLELPPAELAKWAKALKSALGCGGGVEEGAIVLQGDQRERLEALLVQRGVRKVTIG